MLFNKRLQFIAVYIISVTVTLGCGNTKKDPTPTSIGQSCNKGVTAANPQPKTTNISLNLQAGKTITYEGNIKEFWTPNCVTGCHTTDGSYPPLQSWSDIAANAKLAVATTKAGARKKMPIGGKSLTDSQKKLLLDWEQGGFLQGTPPPTTNTTNTSASNNGSTVTNSSTNKPTNSTNNFNTNGQALPASGSPGSNNSCGNPTTTPK